MEGLHQDHWNTGWRLRLRRQSSKRMLISDKSSEYACTLLDPDLPSRLLRQPSQHSQFIKATQKCVRRLTFDNNWECWKPVSKIIRRNNRSLTLSSGSSRSKIRACPSGASNGRSKNSTSKAVTQHLYTCWWIEEKKRTKVSPAPDPHNPSHQATLLTTTRPPRTELVRRSGNCGTNGAEPR